MILPESYVARRISRLLADKGIVDPRAWEWCLNWLETTMHYNPRTDDDALATEFAVRNYLISEASASLERRKEETYWDVIERLRPREGDLLFNGLHAWIYRDRGEGVAPYLEWVGGINIGFGTIWNNYLNGVAPERLKLYREVEER